ncbi:hypothetical protein ACIGPN_06050 [Streptomyces afghaniensis]|uniref:hypothetical protein n=1 Tax=Streptomyces afghaniensis TaxID=66865 RepID=UPI0037D299DB
MNPDEVPTEVTKRAYGLKGVSQNMYAAVVADYLTSGVDPACSADYLRKRFEERIWEYGPLSEFLHTLSECAADEVVTNLVTGLLIETGAE